MRNVLPAKLHTVAESLYLVAVISVCPCTSLYYVLVKVPLKTVLEELHPNVLCAVAFSFQIQYNELLGITVNKLLLTFCSCKNDQIIKILLIRCDIVLLCETVYLACNILTCCRALGGLLRLSNKEYSLVSSLRGWLVSPPRTVVFWQW